ncbi:MAG: MFS transporter [Alphaproteobacteria bacterium]|nr:MFS transporter [Alphaproteobacteria bacterium]
MTQSSAESGAEQNPSRHDTQPSPIRWLVLFGVWGVYFSFGLTIAGLAPLIGPITRDLDISHTAMGGVLGIWQLIYIMVAVPCGAFLDRIGARRALFIGALIIAGSGLLRGIADGALMLYFAVGLFGVGGPIVSAGAPKVIARWFKGSERGLAMGMYITGPNLGAIVSFALTNSLLMPALDNDWRLVLQIWALVAFIAGLLWLLIASLRPVRSRDDAEEAATKKAPQMETIKALVAIPAVRILLVMSVGIFMYNHGLSNWLPELLRVSGMTPVEAGYWATVPTVIGILGALTIPRLATPDRRFRILAILFVAALASCILIEMGWTPGLMVGLILQGIARSSLMTVAILTLVETPGVGEERAGTAGGLFFSAAEIGGAGGPFLLGLLYDATGGFEAGLLLLGGLSASMLFCVAALAKLGKSR